MTRPMYHFVATSRELRDGQKLRVGKVYRLPTGTEPVLCEVGYHASPTILDALTYAPGPILCGVELRGIIRQDADKAVASQRKVLWARDVSPELRGFAGWCARRALTHAIRALEAVGLDAQPLRTARRRRDWPAAAAYAAHCAFAWASADAAAQAAAEALALERRAQARKLQALVSARRTAR